jgi:hypothetical protein
MKLARSISMAAALALVVANGAMAGFTAGPFAGASAGPVGDAGNGTASFNYAGPEFTPGIVTIEGDLTSGGTGSWSRESNIQICNPSVCLQTAEGSLNTGTGAYVSVHIGPVNLNSGGLFTGTSIGNWTFEFFETYDDPGTDANWSNLSITIQDAAPYVPPTNTNLGVLPDDDSLVSASNTLASGQVDWYAITLPYAVQNFSRWLNIRTTGMDTELGIYNSAGNFVGTDDDGNGGFPPGHSMLSFGAADPHAAGSGTAAGADGLSLPAGTYYVAVGGWNTVFGLTTDSVTGGTETGTYDLNINYLPEPATLTLLAFAGFGLIRRRR